jgi:hypothetical protein
MLAAPVSCRRQPKVVIPKGGIPSLGINPEGRQPFGANQPDFQFVPFAIANGIGGPISEPYWLRNSIPIVVAASAKSSGLSIENARPPVRSVISPNRCGTQTLFLSLEIVVVFIDLPAHKPLRLCVLRRTTCNLPGLISDNGPDDALFPKNLFLSVKE